MKWRLLYVPGCSLYALYLPPVVRVSAGLGTYAFLLSRRGFVLAVHAVAITGRGKALEGFASMLASIHPPISLLPYGLPFVHASWAAGQPRGYSARTRWRASATFFLDELMNVDVLKCVCLGCVWLGKWAPHSKQGTALPRLLQAALLCVHICAGGRPALS